MADRSRPNGGARLEIPPIATELGERFRLAGHELYLVGGAVRELLLGAGARERSRLRDRRRPAGDDEGSARVGRAAVPGRREVRDRRRPQGGPGPGDHDLPRGGLRGGAPQACRDVRQGPADRPVPARLHRQRDGDPAARGRVRRSVRRREGSRGQAARHAARPRDRVLGRPAADAPRGQVRRAARSSPRRRAWCGRSSRCTTASRSCRPSGSATSSPSCSPRPPPRADWSWSSRPVSRRSSCPSSPRSSSSRTPCTSTRTCCTTRSPWSRRRRPTRRSDAPARGAAPRRRQAEDA